MFKVTSPKSSTWILRKRHCIGVWFPKAIEPVCLFFPLKSLERLSLQEDEEQGWALLLVTDERSQRLARFQSKEDADEALKKLSHALLKRSFLSTQTLKILAVVLLGLLVLNYLISAPLSPHKESPPIAQENAEKIYGVPIDAAQFLKRSPE